MLLKKFLIHFTFWALWSVTQLVHAQALSLTLNKNAVTTGDTLAIYASVDHTIITASKVDVYLSVQLPNGALYYLAGLNGEFAESNLIVPLVTNWLIATLSDLEIVKFTIPKGLPNGTYKWYLTFCQTGQNVAQPANWIANASASLILSGSIYYTDEDTTSYEYADEEMAYAPVDDGVTTSDDTYMSRPTTTAITTSKGRPPPPAAPSGAATSAGSAEEESAGIDYTLDDRVTDKPMTMPFPEKEINFQSGTLTAGDLDDNLNFTAFQDYLDQQLQADPSRILPTVNLADRVMLRVVDENGRGVSYAQIQIIPEQSQTAIFNGFTATNGDFYLFPKFESAKLDSTKLQLTITPPQDAPGSPATTNVTTTVDIAYTPPQDATGSPATINVTTTVDIAQIDRDQITTITIPHFTTTLPPAIDIMLVIDTTGSMADELKYIATEFRDIVGTVTTKHPHISMRFGLIVYRDEGDIYVVKDFGFTDSINLMQNQLGPQSSSGGGDYPEAMEQAMQTALQAPWRTGHVARLLFLIADAPPHDENLSTMLTQIKSAKQNGVRIYPLAASGVGDVAEYIMRIASTVTQGRYLFLTDDSGVGGGHATPSTRCYQVTRLDQLISRVIASELAGQRLEPTAEEIIRTVGQYDRGRCTK